MVTFRVAIEREMARLRDASGLLKSVDRFSKNTVAFLCLQQISL